MLCKSKELQRQKDVCIDWTREQAKEILWRSAIAIAWIIVLLIVLYDLDTLIEELFLFTTDVDVYRLLSYDLLTCTLSFCHLANLDLALALD